MKNIVIEDYPGTAPPSTAIVMMIESEGDRALIAELVDQPIAGRCHDPVQKQVALHGRILGSPFDAHLSNKDVIDNPEYRTKILAQVREVTGLSDEEIRKKLFIFRFFHY